LEQFRGVMGSVHALGIFICKENKMALGFESFTGGTLNDHGWRSPAMALYHKATSMCYCFPESRDPHLWNIRLIVPLLFLISTNNEQF